MDIDEYARRFDEEPGYLDFGYAGPMGRTVREEVAGLVETQARARFGWRAVFDEQSPRLRDAVAALTGFPAEQVVFQPNAGTAFMHTMFGITGGVALSPAEFPAITYAAARAAAALGVLVPAWLETDHGRVTPGNLRDQLTSSTVAVAFSLVDFRTGFLADLEGIRQVAGDRLLVVDDATQCFGAVDAPWQLADVVIAGGYKWPRAGWGTGFLALSERALAHLTPVWSGFAGDDGDGLPLDEVREPAPGAERFLISHPDPIAEGRLAAALEEIASVGVSAVNARIAENVGRIIELADEFAVPVVSPRAGAERAGIVVLQPDETLTALAASLHNHGVSATVRGGSVRLAPHVSTEEETFTMLRAALQSYATATAP